MDEAHQRRLAAGIQRRFATLAHNEGARHLLTAKADLKAGNTVLAQFHKTEAARDFEWEQKRLRSAAQYSPKKK